MGRLSGKKAAWRQEDCWKHLKSIFGSIRPDELSTADLTSYQETRIAEKASPATINRELLALSAALFHAARTSVAGGKALLAHVTVFPAKLREASPRQGFITDREYSVLRFNAKPLWLRALIAYAFHFGFRKSELLNLRVRQVDFFERWIELEEGSTKNDEARKVHMTSEVFHLLKECAAEKNANDCIFTRDDKSRVLDPRDDWYALCVTSGFGQFVPAKRKNGKDFLAYRGLNLHDFRRSAIREMTRRGVNETVAMKISGHKTASVFRRYNIVSESDLIDATRKLELSRQAGNSETDTKTDTS